MTGKPPYEPSADEICRCKHEIRRKHLMGRQQVQKGKRGENMAAGLLSALFDCRCERGTTGLGVDVRGDLPIHVEVKNWKTRGGPIFDAVDQAERDAGEKVPVAMVKNSRRDFLLCIRAADLWRLFDAIREYR